MLYVKELFKDRKFVNEGMEEATDMNFLLRHFVENIVSDIHVYEPGNIGMASKIEKIVNIEWGGQFHPPHAYFFIKG
jgi:hypothetical protein